jgi:RNA polymerase sigma factor (sigma-70 family)
MQAKEEETDQLAREYAHRVRFFAHKVARMFLLGSRWEDELVSAGYWGLAKALNSRRPEASRHELSAYVSQRILGAVIDEVRCCISRAGKEVTSSAQAFPGEFDSWRDPGPSPEQTVADRSVWHQIDGALSVLDPEQRLVVRTFLEGASITDIAGRQGIPVGTTRARFEKAARVLRGRAPHIRRVLREAASEE